MLPDELARLVQVPACDEVGQKWLKSNWVTNGSTADTELHPAPVLLSAEVIEQLNTVCSNKGVPRDAFIDCALAYLTQRLYEAVIVIKKPRNSRDLLAQLVDVLHEAENTEELEISERRRWIAETVEGWWDGRQLGSFNDDFYRIRLSYNVQRIESERSLLESMA